MEYQLWRYKRLFNYFVLLYEEGEVKELRHQLMWHDQIRTQFVYKMQHFVMWKKHTPQGYEMSKHAT